MSSKSCPPLKGAEPLTFTGSAYRPMLIAAGACTAVTLLSTVGLAVSHLVRYRVPKEQRQIVRIIFTPFVFAIFSLAIIVDYRVAAYLEPIPEIYEAFCLCALFLLYVEYATSAEGASGSEDVFTIMRNAAEMSQAVSKKPGWMNWPQKVFQSKQFNQKNNWPHRLWVMVFQFPVVELISIIIAEATLASGTFCSTSLRPRFGHLWYMLLRTFGVIVCVIGVIGFYNRAKGAMPGRRAMRKLVAFKLIVGIQFIQSVSVQTCSVHKPKGDLEYGLPGAIHAVEMMLFSFLFWWAFSAAEYSSSNSLGNEQQLGYLSAAFHATNPMDVVLGIARMVAVLRGRVVERSYDSEQAAQYAGKYGGFGGQTVGSAVGPPKERVAVATRDAGTPSSRPSSFAEEEMR